MKVDIKDKIKELELDIWGKEKEIKELQGKWFKRIAHERKIQILKYYVGELKEILKVITRMSSQSSTNTHSEEKS